LNQKVSFANDAIDNLRKVVRLAIPFGDINFFGQIDGIRASFLEAEKSPATWGALDSSPSLLWDMIEPLFRLRDEVADWLLDNFKIKALSDISNQLSEAIDMFVYSQLAIVIGPIISDIRDRLKDQKDKLEETARNQMAQENLHDNIFAPGSKASDPSHSQLAKDHFDSVLNAPAGMLSP
jgi:Heterokaryon incompatibility protein Het-C